MAAMGDRSLEWSASHCISTASSIEGLYASSGARQPYHLEFYECAALYVALDRGSTPRCDMRRDCTAGWSRFASADNRPISMPMQHSKIRHGDSNKVFIILPFLCALSVAIAWFTPAVVTNR